MTVIQVSASSPSSALPFVFSNSQAISRTEETDPIIFDVETMSIEAESDMKKMPTLKMFQNCIKTISHYKENSSPSAQFSIASTRSFSTLDATKVAQEKPVQIICEKIRDFIQYKKSIPIRSQEDEMALQDGYACLIRLPPAILIHNGLSKILFEIPRCPYAILLEARLERASMYFKQEELTVGIRASQNDLLEITFYEPSSGKWVGALDNMQKTIVSDEEVVFQKDAVHLIMQSALHKNYWWRLGAPEKLGVPDAERDFKKDQSCLVALRRALKAVIVTPVSSLDQKVVAIVTFLETQADVLEQRPELFPATYDDFLEVCEIVIGSEAFTQELKDQAICFMKPALENMLNQKEVRSVLLSIFKGLCCVYEHLSKNPTQRDWITACILDSIQQFEVPESIIPIMRPIIQQIYDSSGYFSVQRKRTSDWLTKTGRCIAIGVA